MLPRPKWLLLLTALAVVHLPLAGAEQESPSIALLRLDGVKQPVPARPGAAEQDLAPLTDGKTDQFLKIELKPGLPFDVTYHLPAVATCQHLVISADTRDLAEKQLPRVEVLVSTVSGKAGIQAIRSLSLKATADPQRLDLPPSAARWIIVRIVSPLEPTTLQLAEIDVQGNEGLPETRYAFKEAPAKAFAVLNEVQKSVSLKISDDEASLFEDASDGKLDNWSFAEAALVSSGILEAEKRKKYLARIDRITEQAKDVVKGLETPYEKGEKLLRWLHANTMSEGYESGQTDLAVILDSGKFNCVSSATLYNIIGRRLGLDLRSIEVPDHAFSIQYVGTRHADVETTNPAGFNPARDPRILEQFTEETGFTYIPDQHVDERREVNDIGLVALTYYNHAVNKTHEEQHAAALLDFFRALSLDPEFPSAIQGVLGALHNWSLDLFEQGKFEQSLAVISTGLRLAPDDSSLRHSQRAVWQDWVVSEINNDNLEAALEILTRAAESVPKGGFEEMMSLIVELPGEKLVKAEKWEEALQLAAEGLKTLPPTTHENLLRWRNGVFGAWVTATLREKDYAAAADILEQAMKAAPEDRDFAYRTTYVVQEWLAETEAQDGLAAAESLMAELAERFRAVRDIENRFDNFLRIAIQALAKDDKFDEALALVERREEQLAERTFTELQRIVFLSQTRKLRNQEKWEEAIAVGKRGIEKLPRDSDLERDLVFTYQNWARVYRGKKDWSAAADVYLPGLKIESISRDIGQRIGYCVQELGLQSWKSDGPEAAEKQLAVWVTRQPDLGPVRDAVAAYVQTVVKKYQQDKQPARALEAVDRCRTLLTANDHKDFVRRVCSDWARIHIDKSEWDEARAVYTLGLKSLPKDGDLKSGVAKVWFRQAEVYQKEKDWSAAADVYLKALKAGIDKREMGQRIGFCVQELGLQSWKSDGPEATEKLLAVWVTRQPDLGPVRDAVAAYVQTVVKKYQQDKQPARALEAVDRCRTLLTANDHKDFVRRVCNQWAKSNIDKADWEKAIMAYTLGLKSLPKDSLLTRNAIVTWNLKADEFIKVKKWAEAIKVYEQGLAQFPDDSTLSQNLKYCQEQADK